MNNMVNHIFKSIDMVGSMAARNRASIMKLSRSNFLLTCVTLCVTLSCISMSQKIDELQKEVNSIKEETGDIYVSNNYFKDDSCKKDEKSE